MADNRPCVVIYGSCQAQFLCFLLRQVPSLTRRFDFQIATIAAPNGTRDMAFEMPADVGRAVLLWEQYDQRAVLEPRDAVLRAVPAGCRVLRFPAVAMNALWPFRIKDRRNRAEAAYPWGRYPQSDWVASAVAELGLPSEESYKRYIERSRAAMPDLERLIDRDRATIAARDAACDVMMEDAVFDHLCDRYQFWTHGHLATGLLAILLQRLLAASREIIGELDETVLTELDAAYALYPGQGEQQLPIHPLVIERLGLRFVDEDTRYRWYGNSWTFAEFTTRLIAFDTNW